MSGSSNTEQRARHLLVPALIIAACTVEFLLFASPHKNNPGSLTYAATTCTVNSLLVSSCRPWLGGAANNYPDAGVDAKSQILYQEERIGRRNDIVHVYYPAGDNKLLPGDQYFAKRGSLLFVSWHPTDNWSTIGAQNAAISTMAASIKQVAPAKVFVSLDGSPESSVSAGGDPNCPNVPYAGSSGSAAQYRALWAYVEKRFKVAGVHNVVWAMDYTNNPAWQCLVPDLYPGDQSVDWVMFNAYESGGDSFDTTVGRMYNFLSKNSNAAHNFASKPWGIGEWSIGQASAVQEEAYIDQAKTALDGDAFPNLKAYMIYDAFDQGVKTGINYRVGYDDNGTPDAAKGAHYYAFADDPRFTDAFYTAAPATVAAPNPTPPPAIAQLTASPAAIPADATATITWQTTNVATDGCALTPGPLGTINGDASWTTAKLAASQTYTLACQNSAGAVVSSSVSVSVANRRAPGPPARPTIATPPGLNRATVKTPTGQSVTNAQFDSTVPAGPLLAIDPATVADPTTIKSIAKVQFYSSNLPLQRIDKPPFALQTARLKPGVYNLTADVYYTDGSMSQEAKSITIKANPAAALGKVGSNTPLWVGVSCGVVLVGVYAIYLRWRLAREARLTDANGTPMITGQDSSVSPRGVLPAAAPPEQHRHRFPW